MPDDLDFPGVAYVSRTVSFDATGIGTAATVPVGKIPGGAIVTDALISVTTAFNAGSTNVLNVGTTDDSVRFLTAEGGASLLARVWRATAPSGIGYNVPVGGKHVWIQYVQTGTAATAGVARVVVVYIPKG